MSEDSIKALTSMVEKRSHPKTSGQWFSIRWTPDIGTGEILNLGLCFIDSESRNITVRTLADYSRLHCLYSKAIEGDCRLLISVVRKALENHLFDESPSLNISYGKPQWAQGESAEEIVESIYRQIVTLEPTPQREENHLVDDHPVQAVKTEHLVNVIYGGIRRRAGISASGIIPQSPYFQVPYPNGMRSLYVPLVGQNDERFGSIVSNVYKTPAVCETKILRAHMDLETVLLTRNPEADAAIFVQKPTPSIFADKEDKRLRIFDEMYDLFTWKMSKQDIIFRMEESQDALLSHIVEWANLEAA